MRVEFWVVEVICHYPGGPRVRLDGLDERTRAQAMCRVEAGELLCLPDGSIAEPVHVFAGEESAHRERERLMKRKPAADYRVVMSSPVPGASS